MYSIIYFSPTGNAFYLAQKLAEHIGNEKVSLSAMERLDIGELRGGKHLILMYPVHGFNAPGFVKDFVKEMKPDLFEFVSLIAVGCAAHWANGAVSSTLRKSLIQKKYTLLADEVLAMPLTFITAFSDEMCEKVISESEERIRIIGDSLLSEQASPHRVAFKSYIFKNLGKIEKPAAKLFGLELHANSNCTSCGTCWENCPVENIGPKANNKPGFAFKCTMCMRCIYNCPEKAISPRFSKFIPIRKGYSIRNYR